MDRFKAFARADVELAPLALFIGINNAGKSSLLHSIALQSQSVEQNGLRTVGPIVDLGQDPSELIHQRSDFAADGKWDTQLTWTGSAAEVVAEPLSFGDLRLTFNAHFTAPSLFDTDAVVGVTDPFGREVLVTAPSLTSGQTNIRVEAGRFRSVNANADEIATEVHYQQRSAFSMQPAIDPSITIDLAQIRQGDPRAIANQALRIASPLLASFVKSTLSAFVYVGANRHVEQSRYPLGVELPPRIYSANDLVTTLAYQPELTRRVSNRCEEIFGHGIEVALVPRQQVSLTAVSRAGRLNITSMGSGFIQLMWVVTMLEIAAMSGASSAPVALAAGIEEPELHLHPAVQPRVARVLSHFVRTGLQIICTTQSEHLLMSILTAVLSGELSPDEVAIYYVSNGVAERLEVNRRGQIAGGLRGFFEANEDELKRYIDLLSQR